MDVRKTFKDPLRILWMSMKHPFTSFKRTMIVYGTSVYEIGGRNLISDMSNGHPMDVQWT